MRESRLTTIRFMLAVGSILLILAAVAPVSGYDSSSCSVGSYIYPTSDGQCCPDGYPYVYDGKCHQCDYGSTYDSYSGRCCPFGSPYYYDGACHACQYGSQQTGEGQCCPAGYPYSYDGKCHQCRETSVYDSSSGTCCPWDTPQYYEGACHACRYGSQQYSTSEGQCCPEGYPYYYDGKCHAESANAGTGVTIPTLNLVTAYTTAETIAPVPIDTVTVPATPTKAPVPALMPVLGIGIMCVVWGIARKNK